MNDLFLIAINLTRRCNLACAHCYMDAEKRLSAASDELSTTEVETLLEEIASRSPETMVVLTGGEPLLRRDLERLVRRGRRLGLAMVVGTNGVLLDRPRSESLKAAGVMGIGISLDSLDPATHDDFRGCPGAWQKSLSAMDNCRALGLPFQVHFSVTERNADEIESVIDFSAAAGAHVLNVFFLVCTGRGESVTDISPPRYERTLNRLLESQEKHPGLLVRARCAPHFKRIAHQRNPKSSMTRAEGYEGGGCIAGTHYCRITPEGGVTACPYVACAEGNIRERGFWSVWDEAPAFQALRAPRLSGKCGRCEFRKLCGGCRARPLAAGGTLMDSDDRCDYRPTGVPVIDPLGDGLPQELQWSPDAMQRLQHVPGFVRKMVRKRAEDHVRSLGGGTVTLEHLTRLAARRFGTGIPGARPMGGERGEPRPAAQVTLEEGADTGDEPGPSAPTRQSGRGGLGTH